MRNYTDVLNAKSTRSADDSKSSDVLNLPPGYMAGGVVSIDSSSGDLSVSPVVANIAGRRVQTKTVLLNDMTWECPRINNFVYSMYLDPYGNFHVSNVSAVFSDSSYGLYHPDVGSWRFIGKFDIATDGTLSYVVGWNAVDGTRIDLGAVDATKVATNFLSAIIASITSYIQVSDLGIAGYNLAGADPAIGDSRALLYKDGLLIQQITALGSPNTVDNATWATKLQFGGRDQFDQIDFASLQVLMNPSADLSNVPDGDPFPILDGNAESFRFGGDYDSVSGNETLDHTNITLDTGEHFVSTASVNPDLGDVAHAETSDTPLDLDNPLTMSVRFKYGTSALEDVPLIKAVNGSYELGVNMACPYPDQWRQLADYATAYFVVATAQVGSKVYLFVTSGSNTVTLEYDMSADSWATKTGLTGTTGQQAAVSDGTDIYVFYDALNAQRFRKYSPSTDSWSLGSLMNLGHSHVTDCALAYSSGYIYVYGGQDSGYLDTLAKYSISGDSWSSLTSGATGRIQAAAIIYSGKLYVYGGYDNVDLTLSDIWEYDITGDSWTELTDSGQARQGFAMYQINGKLVCLHGYYNDGTNHWLDDVTEYDIAEDSWSSLTSGGTANYRFGWGYYNDTFYVLLGNTSGGNVVDVFRYYYPSDIYPSYASKFFPEIYTKDPTNGTVSHTRMSVVASSGAWQTISLTYEPSSLLARICMNSADYCEYTLETDNTGETPTGAADFQIGDDSTDHLVEVYYDDAMYFSGYAYTKTALFDHHANVLYWSGVKGIADSGDLILIAEDAKKIRAYSDMVAVEDFQTGDNSDYLEVHHNRIDTTNASPDYDLQVGETAVITFSSATVVPLNIATGDGTEYEIILGVDSDYTSNGPASDLVYLDPNNTTYSSAFTRTDTYAISTAASFTPTSRNITENAFDVGVGQCKSVVHIWNKTISKAIEFAYTSNLPSGYAVSGTYRGAAVWKDKTTVWSSLGTVAFPASYSGTILVKRTL